jgi:hypothetical protein
VTGTIQHNKTKYKIFDKRRSQYQISEVSQIGILQIKNEKLTIIKTTSVDVVFYVDSAANKLFEEVKTLIAKCSLNIQKHSNQ